MDFFEHQQRAQRHTWLLVSLFGLAVAGIVAAIYVAALFFVGVFGSGVPTPMDAQPRAGLWQPQLLLFVTTLTLLVVSLGSLYKLAILKQGGRVVAESLGGVPVAGNTRDLLERRLLNVVEEMAIASGIPVPPVYVLPGEQGINAFAAGYGTGDAVVAVTRGTLEDLNREELQGVVGHEFSHIMNGDMRLNLRLMGLLNGILLIGLAGQVLLRGSGLRVRRSSSNNKGAGGILLFALVLLVVGYLGVFFANLIKAAVSRQREYLADASAVQFTRNPHGIAGALKKIGGLAAGSRLRAPRAAEASHMLFASGLRSTLAGLFATHPPLEDRIRRIEPGFDGRFPAVVPQASEQVESAMAFTDTGREAEELHESALGLTPAEVTTQVGTMESPEVREAATTLDSFPARLKDAAHEPFGARAVVYGLLLSPESAAVIEKQWERLRSHADRAVIAELKALSRSLAALGPAQRLPLLELCVPALTLLSEPQYTAFRANVVHLIRADNRISLFELGLKQVVIHSLDRHFGQRPARGMPIYHPRRLAEPAKVVFSALAQVGQDTQEDKQQAFATAMSEFGLTRPGAVLPPFSCAPADLEPALELLERAAPALKKRLLAAAATCVLHNGRVNIQEFELLRAVAATFDLPMPLSTAFRSTPSA